MSHRFIKNKLSYLIFSEIYFRLEEPKARRKAFFILESAITCYFRTGWERTTLEMIAREAGVTRPLLKYYFKDGREIRVFAIKYIRLLFQKFAINYLENVTRPEKKLEAYILACFEWTDRFRSHAVVWLSFLHSCTVKSEDRAINTAAANVGSERITVILQEAANNRNFPSEDVLQTAKIVQVIIMGAMLVYTTENIESSVDAFKKLTVNACLKQAGLS